MGGSITNSESGGEAVSHFWVSSFPFFESILFINPSPALNESQATSLRFYDADGALINESSVQFPPGQVGMVELDQFLGACKLEGGLKHAHLVVRSPAGTSHHCRIHTRESSVWLGKPMLITMDRTCFFPLTIEKERTHLLCFVNLSPVAGQIKCRLFVGKRMPDTAIALPPMASRILCVEAEFSEYTAIEEGKQIQAYARLMSRTDQVIGVQFIERTSGKNESNFYQSVS